MKMKGTTKDRSLIRYSDDFWRPVSMIFLCPMLRSRNMIVQWYFVEQKYGHWLCCSFVNVIPGRGPRRMGP